MFQTAIDIIWIVSAILGDCFNLYRGDNTKRLTAIHFSHPEKLVNFNKTVYVGKTCNNKSAHLCKQFFNDNHVNFIFFPKYVDLVLPQVCGTVYEVVR